MYKEKEKRWKNINVGWMAIIVLLIGVIILLIMHIYEAGQIIDKNTIPVSTGDISVERNTEVSTYDSIVKPIFSNIAITLVVLGIGSLLFEVYGYVSYFRKRISEVFTECEMIDLLNDDYKKRLKFNVTKSLYKPNTDDSKKILNLFDDELDNILDSYYYSDYDLYAEISVLDDKYIKKVITRTITIKEINDASQNEYENFLSISCKHIKKQKVFNLEYVKVNGEEIKIEDYKREDIQPDLKHYPQKFIYSFKNPLKIDKGLTIETKHSTIVPIEDRIYSIRSDKLSKNFKCEVEFDSHDMEIGATGFKFSPNKHSAFNVVKHKSHIKADSKGWLLPGEGVAFTIYPKVV